MKLILNEKQMLEDSMNSGYIDKDKPSNTMRTLVKYYFSIGMNKPQIIDTIDKFFALNMKDYNSVKWQKSIGNMVNFIKRTKDFTLLDIKEVEITESELNTIKKLDNIKFEKLAFVLLVYAKIYNQMNGKDENWVNEEHKYIFSDAKIGITVKDQGKMLYDLKELGLVGFSAMITSTNIKVNFVDEDSPIVFVVSDFRNYVLEYLRWKGENIINCEECGILIPLFGKRQKYCNGCYKKINEADAKNRMKIYRDK